jgi:hypothetical protein
MTSIPRAGKQRVNGDRRLPSATPGMHAKRPPSARFVRLDRDDAGARVGPREVHDRERTRLECCRAAEVGPAGRAGRQGDLAEDLGEDRTVAAEDGGLQGPDAASDDPADVGLASFVCVLADQLGAFGLDARGGGDGAHGAHAAYGRAGDDLAGTEGEQGRDVAGGLLDPSGGEWPGRVLSRPFGGGRGFAVPHGDEGEGRGHALLDERGERLEDLDVALVAEVAPCALDADPLQGGDFPVGDERAFADGLLGDLGRPVVDDLLASAGQRVGGDAEGDPEVDAQSRLLLDLPDGRLREGLARVDLPLGDRDVAVHRAVDDEEVDLAVDETPAHRTGCIDCGRRHGLYLVVWWCSSRSRCRIVSDDSSGAGAPRSRA